MHHVTLPHKSVPQDGPASSPPTLRPCSAARSAPSRWRSLRSPSQRYPKRRQSQQPRLQWSRWQAHQAPQWPWRKFRLSHQGSCFSKLDAFEIERKTFHVIFFPRHRWKSETFARVFCITSWFIPAFMYKNAGMNGQTSPEISLWLMSIPPPCSTREQNQQRSQRCHGPAFDQGTGFPPGKSGSAN